MIYTVVKENGNFLNGRAYEEVVDGHTVHILEVDMTDVESAVVRVSVEGIDG